MPKVHQFASVDPKAQLHESVSVGPFCVVEADVVLGENCVLEAHSCILNGTRMGANNRVCQGAIIGGAPQYRGVDVDVPSTLEIGDRNVIREYVTIHRGSGEGKATKIGDDCYLMAYVHVGHDGNIGNKVTLANNVTLAGHVTIEDLVTFGGLVAVHQFARIGTAAMVGGMAGISRDVPPFCMVAFRDEVIDINAVGLRRIGVSSADRLALHKAVKLLFKSELGLTHAIATVRKEVPMTPQIEYLLNFEERRFRGKNGRGDQP